MRRIATTFRSLRRLVRTHPMGLMFAAGAAGGVLLCLIAFRIALQYWPPPQPLAAAPPAKPPAVQWKYIVIHHSASARGNAAIFDDWHRAKRWPGGLGYHFVIGNGTDSGDGQVEVGPRWTQQAEGAHTKTASRVFNEHGIGICLVGNFEETRPTAKQLAALDELVGRLAREHRIPPANVLGHNEAVVRDGGPRSHTQCPGKNLDMTSVRRMAE